MNGLDKYPTLKFVGGLAALAGGAIFLVLGMRGDTTSLILGIVGLALGASIFLNR